MSDFVTPPKLGGLDGFEKRLSQIDESFRLDRELEGANGPLGAELDLFGKRVGNRFCIHPMEGWDAGNDGLPTVHTRRRWRRFGRSTAKLIWGGEAFAVQEDGRANPHQLFLNPKADAGGGLSSLREEVLSGHKEMGAGTDDLLIGLQLTHSGRYAFPDKRRPLRATANPVLDKRMGVEASLPVITDIELEGVAENMVAAAVLAQEVGFDFVDVKCCHGYLLHELLGARGRSGAYGGSFENRTRLVVAIIDEIRSRCPGLGVGVRLSLVDRFPYLSDPETGKGAPLGLSENLPYAESFGVCTDDPMQYSFAEPFALLSLLQNHGVPAVNVSIGSPYYNPHLQRPAAYPPSDGYSPPRDPLMEVFEHLTVMRHAKRAFPDIVLVSSGLSYLQEYLPHVMQREIRDGHADVAGLGRMVLIYPEMPHDVLAGLPLQKRQICRTFSDCTTAPRHGLLSGCYPLDSYYRDLPDAERLKEVKKNQRKRRDGS